MVNRSILGLVGQNMRPKQLAARLAWTFYQYGFAGPQTLIAPASGLLQFFLFGSGGGGSGTGTAGYTSWGGGGGGAALMDTAWIGKGQSVIFSVPPGGPGGPIGGSGATPSSPGPDSYIIINGLKWVAPGGGGVLNGSQVALGAPRPQTGELRRAGGNGGNSGTPSQPGEFGGSGQNGGANQAPGGGSGGFSDLNLTALMGNNSSLLGGNGATGGSSPIQGGIPGGGSGGPGNVTTAGAQGQGGAVYGFLFALSQN